MSKVKFPIFPVLIVDDEAESLEGCEFTLATGGVSHLITCRDSLQVMDILADRQVSVILLDLIMPDLSGEELLAAISEKYPHIPVIVVTGMNQVETAVKCMQQGAFDYIVKPAEQGRMVTSVRRAVELREERLEYQAFRKKVLEDGLDHPEAFDHIITADKGMRSVFQYVETIASTGKPVLITGESGVGKELVARAVHELSQKEGALISANVAGFDEALFSDTLFGHIKGAFTSASQIREGLIQKASGGTLFLDEIGDLSPANQIKLLRLLQEGEYFPVGSDVPREANVRIITATNRDLQAMQENGQFRRDLYYRLQTHHVHLPRLCERLNDLPLLLDHFLKKAAKSLGKAKPTPPKELVGLLAGYDFPGNIRELESMVFDAVSHHSSRMLSMERFRQHIVKHSKQPDPAPIELFDNYFSKSERLPTLKEAPVMLISEALARTKDNKDLAARMLGITRSGLNKALKRAGLS